MTAFTSINGNEGASLRELALGSLLNSEYNECLIEKRNKTDNRANDQHHSTVFSTSGVGNCHLLSRS